MNEFNQIIVRLKRFNAREAILLINGELNKDLPETIIIALGSSKEELAKEKYFVKKKNEKKTK